MENNNTKKSKKIHIQRVMEILVQTLTGDRSPLENYIYRKNVRAKLHRLGARSLQSRLASNRYS